MAGSETQIANLLYRYAECIDSGDLEGAAALFARARIKTAIGEIGAQGRAEDLASKIKLEYLYPLL